MNLRSIAVAAALSTLALFTALNWQAFLVSTTLSLGIAEVQAPLGLIMLAVTAGVSGLFLVYILFQQASVMLEARRMTKELQAQREAVAASTERSAVLSEAFSRGLSKLRSTRNTTGSTSSSFEQLGQTLNRLDQITKSVAETTGMSQSQVANIAFGAAAHIGLNTAVAGGRINASSDKSYLSGLSAQEQKVLGSMTSEQISEFKQFGDRVSRDTSFASVVASDSREAREMASRLSSTAARSARADASMSQRTAYAERMSSAYERGEVISIDIAQDPHNLV